MTSKKVKNNICQPRVKANYSVQLNRSLTKLELFFLATIYEFKKIPYSKDGGRTVAETLKHFFKYGEIDSVCKTVLWSLSKKKLIKARCGIEYASIDDITVCVDFPVAEYLKDTIDGTVLIDMRNSKVYENTYEVQGRFGCAIEQCSIFKANKEALKELVQEWVEQTYGDGYGIKKITVSFSEAGVYTVLYGDDDSQ